MRRMVLVLIVAACAAGAGAEVIDRIVAVVNKTPILASDWDDQVRYEAFVEGRAIPGTASAERRAALDRLVDQALIEEQIAASNYIPARDAEITAATAQVRQQVSPDAGGWAAALRRYGLTETDVAARVRRQVNQLRYIELRFRREAKVAPADIEHYYSDQYQPAMKRAGADAKPLAEVQAQIEQIVTEQKINDLAGAWLQSLREHSAIARRDAPPAADATTQAATAGGRNFE